MQTHPHPFCALGYSWWDDGAHDEPAFLTPFGEIARQSSRDGKDGRLGLLGGDDKWMRMEVIRRGLGERLGKDLGKQLQLVV